MRQALTIHSCRMLVLQCVGFLQHNSIKKNIKLPEFYVQVIF